MRGLKFIKPKLKFVLLFPLLFTARKPCAAQEIDYKTYSLFVYNFMKYIDWPPEIAAKNEFVVGIIGDSPISKELQALAATKKVKGKTIVLKKFTTVEECSGCQLLYVASGKSSMIKTIRESLKTKPVLVVGEREGTAKKGAALSFVTLEDDVLKFDINKAEIEQRQLKISSSLITLGIVIG
ncbi:MAG TPA: YfiR family protein [Flavobacteriales bacterium]|nr:YfiR family protein [Flavobacteriales bacterium]